MNVVVRDRMTSPARTVDASTPLTALARVFETDKVSAFPVLDGKHLVGIVSSTDLVRERAAGTLTADRTARDAMTASVLSAKADESLLDAVIRMTGSRVHRLVVVDDGGDVRGVLSTRDVLPDVVAARLDTPLEQIMTREVITIDVGDPIDLGVEKLAQSNVRGLVVAEGRRPVGVFTHVEALAARKLPPLLRSQPIETVMSYETICLDAGTPVYRAAAHALSLGVRRILVVHDRELVGILSCLDLAATLARIAS
jgi:CBS domain-containing protein